jgi:hypothetical protein
MRKHLLKAAGILAPLAMAALAYGSYSGKRRTGALRERLGATRLPATPGNVDFKELAPLPAPVQRYLRKVLREGMPMVAEARIEHRGTFNMGSSDRENWKPFDSSQLVVTRRPGFDWNARVAVLPLLHVDVHDSYIAGEGLLHATLLGLFPVAHMQGVPGLAEGELMRFLAEAVWYPTALLPSQGVLWEALDANHAKATVTDGAARATLLFGFDDQGLVATVRAEARGRAVNGRCIPTAWQGRFRHYRQRTGMLLPLEGEVAWMAANGAQPYWRGSITAITHSPL